MQLRYYGPIRDTITSTITNTITNTITRSVYRILHYHKTITRSVYRILYTITITKSVYRILYTTGSFTGLCNKPEGEPDRPGFLVIALFSYAALVLLPFPCTALSPAPLVMHV